MKTHIHKYRFDCETENHHKHRLMGYTDNMIGINAIHFHYFFGVSSYDGHSHYYSGITGLPIKTENGHVHKIEGTLESTCLHEHKFASHTFEDVAYTFKKSSNKLCAQ
ncbi:MAG: YmaF family protein [Clostridia bacterium]|nr:YmaF family protein [Clostridia bacterium]